MYICERVCACHFVCFLLAHSSRGPCVIKRKWVHVLEMGLSQLLLLLILVVMVAAEGHYVQVA